MGDDIDFSDLAEWGRRLASMREDLIASGVDPRDLTIPYTRTMRDDRPRPQAALHDLPPQPPRRRHGVPRMRGLAHRLPCDGRVRIPTLLRDLRPLARRHDRDRRDARNHRRSLKK